MAKNSLQVYIGANTAGLKNGVKEAKGALSDLAKSVNSLEGVLGGIAGMGALAGPLNAAKEWAAAVNDLEDKTNMAGESASRLLAIGQRVGLSTGEMGNAIMRMSKAAQTSNEHFGESSDVFSKWGIAIRDANGQLLSAEQILGNAAEVHRNMANGVQKNAMEMEIFGRAGGRLNDLLNFSNAELKEFGDRAERMGLVLSHETTQAFENVQFRINDTKNAMQGLAVRIGSQMLPEFEKLANFTAGLAEDLAASSTEQKRFIAVALEGIGGIGAMAVAVNGLATAYGFVQGAATKAAAAVKAATTAILATPVGIIGSMVATAGAVAYEGYQKSTAVNSKGERLWEYQNDGESDFGGEWVRTSAVDDTGLAAEPQTPEAAAENQALIETAKNEQVAIGEQNKTAIVAEGIAARQELMNEAYTQEAQLAESATNTLLTGLYNCAFASESLSEGLKGVGKSLASLLVQYGIQLAAAVAKDMVLGKKQALSVSQNGITMANGLVPAAVQQSIAMLGPTAGPPAYAAAVGTMTAMGTAMSTASAMSGSISLANPMGLATGGIVTAPTFALIGEGRDNEAVIPLNSSSFEQIAQGIVEAGAMQNTLIINGNVGSSDVDDIMEEFSDAILSGLRGA